MVVAASGTSGAGRAASRTCSASEVMGALSPYKAGGVHQHTPEMEQSLTAAAGDRRDAVVHPGAGADAARHPRHLHRPAGRRASTTATLRAALHAAYDDEPFVHVLPEGALADDRPRRSARNAVHLQVAADAAQPAGPSWSARSTTWARAPPARPCRTPTSCSACPRPPACPSTGSRRERHRRRTGFRAAGVAAGLKSSRRCPTSRWSSTTARTPAAAGGLHRQPGQGRAGALDPAGACAAAGSAPWCSTPAAPTPAPARPGFQDTHATAEQVADGARRVGAGEVAVCSTGLIGERLPMDELLAGVDAAVPLLAATAATTRPTRS